MTTKTAMGASFEPPVILAVRPPLLSNRAHPRTSGLPLIVVIGAVILATVLVAILFLFDPRQFAFYPRCLLHATTGLLCPGCGALRGMHELLHGHFLAAVQMNSLLFLGLPACGAVYLYQRLRNKGGANASVARIPVSGWGVLVVIVLFWVLRNIPIYPFTLLAP